MAMVKPIHSITPFTLLDYPAHTACIIWYAGCNMRCVYCYNPDIVLGKGKLSLDEVERFLLARQYLLDAVVFSGGECTLHPSLLRLARLAKTLGYLVKVDTNGCRPSVLAAMLEENLLDYVALDFKAPGSKFRQITQLADDGSFAASLALLQQSGIAFEVRTTWHSSLLSMTDLRRMIDFLDEARYQGSYYIQHYRNGVTTLQSLPTSSEESWYGYDLSTNEIKVKLRNFAKGT